MDVFDINGGKPLSGSITVEGSKNAALPVIAATLLIGGESIIRNVPSLRDIHVMKRLMEALGAKVEFDQSAGVMKIDASKLTSHVAPYELVSQMRGAFVALGPLLARLGEAKVSLPGGCSLGARPVDYHIKGLRAMGAEIELSDGYVIAKRPKGQDSVVYFDRQSHTGTENLIFAAALGTGTTTIINAACDPEVVDCANFINAAGGKVVGAGSMTITVTAVPNLKPVEFTVSGDRLVAGTYLFATAATGGDVEVKGCPSDQLLLPIMKLREMGCEIEASNSTLQIKALKRLKATSAVTCPFPGFPTDLQACLMAAMTVAEGVSNLRETVFEDRFGHAMEMRRLGADIRITSDEAIITGKPELRGATVMASDIRAGAGLVIACLAARKQSRITRVYHIDRGYEALEDKLNSLGADITRRSE